MAGMGNQLFWDMGNVAGELADGGHFASSIKPRFSGLQPGFVPRQGDGFTRKDTAVGKATGFKPSTRRVSAGQLARYISARVTNKTGLLGPYSAPKRAAL